MVKKNYVYRYKILNERKKIEKINKLKNKNIFKKI